MIIPTTTALGLGLLQIAAWVQVIRVLVSKMEDPFDED